MTDDAERKRAARDLTTSFDAPWLWPKIEEFAREREALAEKRGAIEALEEVGSLLKQNAVISDEFGFIGEWVVIPAQNFDTIRALLEARRKA